jgi:hypothetical protein
MGCKKYNLRADRLQRAYALLENATNTVGMRRAAAAAVVEALEEWLNTNVPADLSPVTSWR